MFERLRFRFTTWASRYGESAPVVCCGVCKPCVTTAATGLAAGAAAKGVQIIKGRRSDDDPRDA